MPILLLIISITGLVMALAGDGVWDVFSWILMIIPLYVIIRKYFFFKK